MYGAARGFIWRFVAVPFARVGLAVALLPVVDFLTVALLPVVDFLAVALFFTADFLAALFDRFFMLGYPLGRWGPLVAGFLLSTNPLHSARGPKATSSVRRREDGVFDVAQNVAPILQCAVLEYHGHRAVN